MQVLKNLKIIILIIVIIILLTVSNAKSTEECFEKTSRAIFKFNMAIDDALLEPIAKGYNKLPAIPIKKGTSNFTSNIGNTCCQFQIIILQGNVKQLGHSVEVF